MERKKKIQKQKTQKTQEKPQVEQINFLNSLQYSQRYFELLETRKKLPAFKQKNKLLKLLETNDVIIIQGETGSGKTTQVPQFLLESNLIKTGKIACTQPRRIAAISVAQRVCQETDTNLGEQIGYSIRFEERSNHSTLLKYMTDGMLIRELISDHNLEKYSIVILDEAHERSLNTDILLGILKKLVLKRSNSEKPLKLILMSATIEIQKFQNYFDNQAPLLTIPGRQHPVEIYYTPYPVENYLETAIKTAVQIHINEDQGDILVFLTGEEEIEYAVNRIQFEIGTFDDEVQKAVILPLYGALSANDQQKVFKKFPNSRKIIVSTNIAETSVTIDGIVFVIDAGFHKEKVYNPRTHFESLLVSPISKSSAKQRAGRAGRTKPGKCYRLYTEENHENELLDHAIPEVQRIELSSMILQLASLGTENIIRFDFIEGPSPETVSRALDILVQIGAIDGKNAKITNKGLIMSQFPLEPKITQVLFKSYELNCEEQVLRAISVFQSGNWKIRPKDKLFEASVCHNKFKTSNCDFNTASEVFRQYEQAKNKNDFCFKNFLNQRCLKQAQKIFIQLKSILFKFQNNFKRTKHYDLVSVYEKVKICFLSGLLYQVAYLSSGKTYKVFDNDHQVLVHPGSLMKDSPKWLIYLEFVITTKNYLRIVTGIEGSWLFDLYPHIFDKERENLNNDSKKALKKIKIQLI